MEQSRPPREDTSTAGALEMAVTADHSSTVQVGLGRSVMYTWSNRVLRVRTHPLQVARNGSNRGSQFNRTSWFGAKCYVHMEQSRPPREDTCTAGR